MVCRRYEEIDRRAREDEELKVCSRDRGKAHMSVPR